MVRILDVAFTLCSTKKSLVSEQAGPHLLPVNVWIHAAVFPVSDVRLHRWLKIALRHRAYLDVTKRQCRHQHVVGLP